MICLQSLQLTQKRHYSLLLFLSLSQQVLLSDDPAAWSSVIHGKILVTEVGMELLTAETNVNEMGHKVALVASLIAHTFADVHCYGA